MAMGGDRKQQRHRVRVATVVIDVTDLEQAAAFWSAALDTPVSAGDPAQDRYVSLGQAAGGLRLLLQRVPEPSRDKNAVHLDLETDDPQAEVARLTSLGASRDRPLGHGAFMLQDPAGNRFCVIYPETPDWPQGTKVVAGPTPTRP
jgi:predicted enzyme related to lactoylglutathione lyase